MQSWKLLDVKHPHFQKKCRERMVWSLQINVVKTPQKENCPKWTLDHANTDIANEEENAGIPKEVSAAPQEACQ